MRAVNNDFNEGMRVVLSLVLRRIHSMDYDYQKHQEPKLLLYQIDELKNELKTMTLELTKTNDDVK